jgi:type IV pilus assembly protein PilA
MNLKIKKNKGFTLAELMITTTIVMILALIAIPSYQQYTIKAQVAEGLLLAQGLQTVEENYYANNKNFPNLVENHIPTPTGKYTSSVTVNSTDGAIIISYGGEQADDNIGKNAKIVLAPVVDSTTQTIGHWNCYIQGTMKQQYVQQSCQASNDTRNTEHEGESNSEMSHSKNLSNNGFENFAKSHHDQLVR